MTWQQVVLTALPYVAVLVGGYILFTKGGDLAKSLFASGGWGSAAAGTALVVSVIAIILGVLGVINPSAIPAVTDAVNGPSRAEAQARADVVVHALDPGEDMSVWTSAPAQAAADTVESEYDARAAEQIARQRRAEAEQQCALAPAQRDPVWMKTDPCEYSMSPYLRVVPPVVSADKISEALKTVTTQTLGPEPADTTPWLPRTLNSMSWGAAAFLLLVVALWPRKKGD